MHGGSQDGSHVAETNVTRVGSHISVFDLCLYTWIEDIPRMVEPQIYT